MTARNSVTVSKLVGGRVSELRIGSAAAAAGDGGGIIDIVG